MQVTNKILFIIIVLAAMLRFSLVLAHPHQTASSAAVSDDKVITVNVATVGTQSVPSTVQALGSLSAIQKVIISSEDDGRIDKINFASGADVNKDMPIIQLNNVQVQAAYQQAVTDYQLAQKKYERSSQIGKDIISQQALDTLKAAVATKHAAVQSAQAALSKKQVLAPFSGVLGAFQVQVGAYVKAGDPLVSLVNSDQLQADYGIAENLLPQLKKGQLVTLKVNTYPDSVFYGTVSFIAPTIDQNTRTVAIQAVVPNKNNKLKPGMFIHVSQQVSVQKNAIVVPEQATLADVKGYYVFKVENNKAAQTYVKLGARVGGNVQVLSGLKLGDIIVVAGQQKLNDGSAVTISSSPTG
jgi:membrane fusion protein, multidrug efflux system